jgi:hypothetical protein
MRSVQLVRLGQLASEMCTRGRTTQVRLSTESCTTQLALSQTYASVPLLWKLSCCQDVVHSRCGAKRRFTGPCTIIFRLPPFLLERHCLSSLASTAWFKGGRRRREEDGDGGVMGGQLERMNSSHCGVQHERRGCTNCVAMLGTCAL